MDHHPSVRGAHRHPTSRTPGTAWLAHGLLGVALTLVGGCGSGAMYQGGWAQAFSPIGVQQESAATASPDEILSIEMVGTTTAPAQVDQDRDPAPSTFLLPAVRVVPGPPQELTIALSDGSGRTRLRTVLVGISP